jgi:hypothetical protein
MTPERALRIWNSTHIILFLGCFASLVAGAVTTVNHNNKSKEHKQTSRGKEPVSAENVATARKMMIASWSLFGIMAAAVGVMSFSKTGDRLAQAGFASRTIKAGGKCIDDVCTDAAGKRVSLVLERQKLEADFQSSIRGVGVGRPGYTSMTGLR